MSTNPQGAPLPSYSGSPNHPQGPEVWQHFHHRPNWICQDWRPGTSHTEACIFCQECNRYALFISASLSLYLCGGDAFSEVESCLYWQCVVFFLSGSFSFDLCFYWSGSKTDHSVSAVSQTTAQMEAKYCVNIGHPQGFLPLRSYSNYQVWSLCRILVFLKKGRFSSRHLLNVSSAYHFL